MSKNGKIGLFATQGEIASAFEMSTELKNNLKYAGFVNIKINDIFDIYRIVSTKKI